MPALLTHFKCLGNSHRENLSLQLSSAQCGVCRSTCSKVHKETDTQVAESMYTGFTGEPISDFAFVFFSFLYCLLQEFKLLALASQIPIEKFSGL